MNRNILSRSNIALLEQFAWSNVLLAFDFDGTLAPIVSRPERAMMRPTTGALFEAVAARYPCIMVSGRARADVARHLHGIGVYEIVGNHGLEPWKASARLAKRVEHWIPLLEQRLAGLAGVEIEDKVYSLAVHYRRSRARRLARTKILGAVSDIVDMQVMGGKQVVNLLPKGAPHKGLALLRERARLGCDTAIYVGDDETDEEVFALDQPGQLLSIRVGPRRNSAASYFIENQERIDDLLDLLWTIRKTAVFTRSGRRVR